MWDLVYSRLYVESARERTHEQVSAYINEALQYNESEFDAYIEQINELIGLPHISDSDKGHLYERKAQIYKFRGDTLNFYHTMGNALYYLEKGGNKSIAVNIYEDIANYYISECNYEQAENIIRNVYSICPINDIDDPQVKSYAYRMEAILARHSGDLKSAISYMDESDRITAECSDQVWYASYVAINAAARSGMILDEGRIDEARAFVDEYRDSDFFTIPIFADIMTRDFVLPYYETACKLAAYDKDEAELNELLDKCSAASSQYSFRRKELSIILDLLEGDYALSDRTRAKLTDTTLLIYSEVTRKQSDEYAAMINSPLENGIHEQEELEREKYEQAISVRIYAVASLVTLIVITVLTLVIQRSLTDPLTGIGNRRGLDYYLHLLHILGRNVHTLMIDADDFKMVNDSFGHDQGDVVLKRIGSLLNAMKSRNNRVFRYGGEEFVVIIHNLDTNAVIRIAENIRRDIEWQVWDFPRKVTVSIGVASGNASMDSVRHADECMYHSKQNGKNAVTYEVNGKKVKLIYSEDSSQS
ncbi:MAG: GGDEF domain-containing protein [Lachnospiraceae bacterium]|nr:GGDEF domain-containing protein [Lachnospiraceae bacterium]